VRFDHRIMHVAARQHGCQFVANKLADAQLTLRTARRLNAMVVAWHLFLLPVVRGPNPRIRFL
jgi:hypothetical protein